MSPAAELEEYLEFTEDVLREEGQYVAHARANGLSVEIKPDGTQVTQVDREVQARIIRRVRSHFTGHAVKGEEGSAGVTNGLHVWDADPLDGTQDYIDGGESNGVGICKRSRGILEVAGFYNPYKDEMFLAARGLGAFLNRKRISVNVEPYRPGIAYDYCYFPDALADTRQFKHILGPRRGEMSAIYQACLVAAGQLAFAVFPGTTHHDITPGALIVREAGGFVTDIHGMPHDFTTDIRGAIFSNKLAFPHVLQALDRIAGA